MYMAASHKSACRHLFNNRHQCTQGTMPLEVEKTPWSSLHLAGLQPSTPCIPESCAPQTRCPGERDAGLFGEEM